MVNLSETKSEQKIEEKAASKGVKRVTFKQLIEKELPTREFDVELEPGEPLSILYKAIDHKDYDKLVAKYPPNKEDQANGASYDFKSFAPALVSAVSSEPKLDLDEAIQIWTSPKYNRGDLMALFTNAVAVCNVGFDVPFNQRG